MVLLIIHSHLTPTSNIISDTSLTLLIIDLSSQQSIFHTPHYYTTVSMPCYYPDSSNPCTHFLRVSLLSTLHSFFINSMCFSLVTYIWYLFLPYYKSLHTYKPLVLCSHTLLCKSSSTSHNWTPSSTPISASFWILLIWRPTPTYHLIINSDLLIQN